MEKILLFILAALIAVLLARDHDRASAPRARRPVARGTKRGATGPGRHWAQQARPVAARAAGRLRARVGELCGGSVEGELDRLSEWASDLAADIRGRIGIYAETPEEAEEEARGALERKAALIASDVAHARRYRRLLAKGSELPTTPPLPDTDAGAHRGLHETTRAGLMNHGRSNTKTELDSLWTHYSHSD